jgi:HEAT repeat protein
MRYRQLKQRVYDLLKADDFHPDVVADLKVSPRQLINPLLSLLYDGEPLVRWRAIKSLGVVVAGLAAANMEHARVVMRRLMWNLNDESGGIGWGSPEAMAEIMACHVGLAREFAHILVSYLNPQGNFLEHEGLQQGVLWGIGRLASVDPQLPAEAAPFIVPFFSSPNALLRGYAVQAAAALPDQRLRSQIQSLKDDSTPITLFLNDRLTCITVAALVAMVYR